MGDDHYFALFGKLLVFVYHCFDRIVVNGYLSGLSRPEQAVYFFREVVGVAGVVLRGGPATIVWVEAFACNHELQVADGGGAGGADMERRPGIWPCWARPGDSTCATTSPAPPFHLWQ
jgi:hypothetical protein